ncbi:hypothetical protein GCM10022253_29930 [Sphingomonas endophytica]|uniref:FeS cluster biogenesis domain-containing protein n=1 Tax=Sphingomonas endophytica TaxID=869719 RepID=A0ABR6N9B6_9SPHN|nr:hypothetical protein [Sphingomonas endophytica]MBB5726641.1 hypothetical protein [Sphingomonas endophytica]
MKSTTDIEAMQNIARLVLRSSPDDAKEVYLEANFLISDEGDVATTRCKYLNEDGGIISFPLTSGIDSHYISLSLKEHKEFFIENGMGEWETFYLTINPETGKIVLNLKYEE